MMEFKYEGDNICRLISDTISGLDPILKAFRVENPNKFYVEQYGGRCDNYLCPINPVGKFRVGLFPRIYKLCIDLFGKGNIKVDKEIINHIQPSRKFNIDYTNIIDIPNPDSSIKFEDREYQTKSIQALMKYGRTIIEIPTAGGKSKIIATAIWNMMFQMNFKHILIYVPNVQLISQFHGDLLDYGFRPDQVCKFTSNAKFGGFSNVIISNRQWLHHHKDELPEIDAVFCDEVHTIKVDSKSYNYIESLPTDFKIGCSGTLPDPNESDKAKYLRWQLEGLFGLQSYVKDVTELQDGGYIAKMKLTHINVIDNVVHKNQSKYRFSLSNRRKRLDDDVFNLAYNDELEYINENYFRLYDKPLRMLPDLNGNTLVLFDRLDFGSNLYEKMKTIIDELGLTKNVFYIDGSTPVDKREEIRHGCETGNNNIIFGQVAVMSTGINIRNLSNIVFMFNSKSSSRIIQSIGRVLRLHKDKDFASVYDITFNFKYSTKQYQKRLDIYLNTYAKENPDHEIEVVC